MPPIDALAGDVWFKRPRGAGLADPAGAGHPARLSPPSGFQRRQGQYFQPAIADPHHAIAHQHRMIPGVRLHHRLACQQFLRNVAVVEGPVGLYLHKTSPDLPPQVGVLVSLAKEAAEVGRDIAQHIAAFAPKFVHRDDVPADLIENERRIAEETAREEGKPEAALSKIIEGRVTGFVKEVSLIEQAFAKDAKKTVKQILDEAGTAVKAFHRFRVGQ